MPKKMLHVLIADTQVGVVQQNETGRLSFTYDDAWREGDVQIPLSLSMPLAARVHDDARISAFIWGLLPDNELTLSRWAQKFQVSARSAFALISAVGEDCAGAVQFLTPEKLDLSRQSGVDWLTEEEIGSRLADLRQDISATRRHEDQGQFSLGGAQAKTAFFYDEKTGRWGVPRGKLPTTHIFKPPMPHLKGHTENEHFCLRLANMAGLQSAQSMVREFTSEKAIIVQRYDRQQTKSGYVRIHQEDMCQALGIPPHKKYETEGGPGIRKIMIDVFASSDKPDEDKEKFMKACIFNFVIAGTDAHAKNYSMLLREQNSASFAPLYDLSSILPHLGEDGIQAEIRDLRMAMKVDKYYKMQEIMPRHWESESKAGRFSPDRTIALLRHFIAVLPDLAADCAAACRKDGLEHEILPKLAGLLAVRAAKLAQIYGAEVTTAL